MALYDAMPYIHTTYIGPLWRIIATKLENRATPKLLVTLIKIKLSNYSGTDDGTSWICEERTPLNRGIVLKMCVNKTHRIGHGKELAVWGLLVADMLSDVQSMAKRASESIN